VGAARMPLKPSSLSQSYPLASLMAIAREPMKATKTHVDRSAVCGANGLGSTGEKKGFR
jgi:hypothetical protein